jgi:hypothetical protein
MLNEEYECGRIQNKNSKNNNLGFGFNKVPLP